jgi:hypothetical protein
MTTLELYKKLPRKNCGRCRFHTCMPFALSIVSGKAELSECPLLKEEEIENLKGSATHSDWQEDLIRKLKEEISRRDLRGMAGGIGAEMDSNALVLKCFGRKFSISPEGEISPQGGMSPWIKILLLHYIRTAGKGGLSGTWISFSELKGGMVKISSFQRDCEEPLAELFDSAFDKTLDMLLRMEAEKQEGFPTPNSWKVYLLPKLPILVLYWPKEEEFSAKVKILFDSTADGFLDVESIIFLVEGLVNTLESFAEIRI